MGPFRGPAWLLQSLPRLLRQAADPLIPSPFSAVRSAPPSDTSSARRMSRSVFAAAVFLGAFLVFQIQPLIGKHILPWFGGAAAVWTTCLLVFQSLLFAGYAYAHGLARAGKRTQVVVHLVVLVIAATITIPASTPSPPAGARDP